MLRSRTQKAPAQQKPKAPALPGATRPVGIAKKQFNRMTDELPAESLYPPLDVPKGMANALSATPYRTVPQATRSSDPTAMRMPGPPKSTHFSDVELKGAFQTFDLGSENKIGVEELRHLFCTMGDEFEQEELEMMVKLLDFHNSGGVAYAEFFSLFRNPEQLFRSRYVSDFLKNRNEEKRLAERTQEEAEAEEAAAAEEEKEVEKGADELFKEMFGGGASGDKGGDLTPADVKLYYKKFKTADLDGNGYLDYDEFCTMMDKEPGQEMSRLFNVFDRDGGGTIDMKEFILGISMFSNAAPSDKLKLSFSMYDEDASGTIDSEELQLLIENNFAFVEGDLTEKQVIERCKQVYNFLGLPDEHDISFSQFMEIAKNKPQLLMSTEHMTPAQIRALSYTDVF